MGAAFRDRARSEARVAVALTAPTNAGVVGERIRLSGRAAVVTNEPVATIGRAQGRLRRQLRLGAVAETHEASEGAASHLAQARRYP